MNLPPYLRTSQMLAGEKTMAKNIEVRKIEDVDFMQVDKWKV